MENTYQSVKDGELSIPGAALLDAERKRLARMQERSENHAGKIPRGAMAQAAKLYLRAKGHTYTDGQRRKGGLITSQRRRERTEAALSHYMPEYVARCKETGERVSKRGLARFACPGLNHAYVAKHYGELIMAMLNAYLFEKVVQKCFSFINAIKAALAKRLGKKLPAPVEEHYPGGILWISSKRIYTHAATMGGEWIAGLAVWGLRLSI